jgi:hypothetical protein
MAKVHTRYGMNEGQGMELTTMATSVGHLGGLRGHFGHSRVGCGINLSWPVGVATKNLHYTSEGFIDADSIRVYLPVFSIPILWDDLLYK